MTGWLRISADIVQNGQRRSMKVDKLLRLQRNTRERFMTRNHFQEENVKIRNELKSLICSIL